jgi:hypothetical protein
MFKNLFKLFRTNKSRRRPAPARARLQIEDLEQRLVMSATTVPWNGGNWFLTGVSLPVTYANWGPGGAGYNSDFGPKTSGDAYYNAVNDELSTLKSQGVHTLRWWMFEAEDQWLFQGGKVQPGALTPTFFQNLDRLLNIAANNQIYVDLTLMDGRVLDNGLAPGNGGHANLATDLNGAGQSFLDNALKPLLQHIASDPAAASYRSYVLAYDVMNEPELGMKFNTGRDGVYGWGNSNADPNLAQMQGFVGRCVSYIHLYGGGALANVGAGTVQDTGLWSGQAADRSDRPDFYCGHYYPDASDNVRGQGLVPASSLLDNDGKPLDRPVVMGEFPTQVLSNLTTNPPSGDPLMTYDPNNTDAPSVGWSARGLMEYIYSQGYAGAIGWSVHNREGWSDWRDFYPSMQAFDQAPAHAAIVGPQAIQQAPPTVLTPAQASDSPVTGTTTNLSVLGADAAGEANLTYTWTTPNAPAGVSYSANGSNAAKITTATFTAAGTYTFEVQIRDAAGLSTTSDVTVSVNQTLTSIAVSPGSASIGIGASQQFTAGTVDQFGNAMAVQPAFAWSVVNGGGSIDAAGLYQAPATAGSATVNVAGGGLSGTASITIAGLSASVSLVHAFDWGTGFTGDLTLVNTGNTAINGWTLEFDFTGNIDASQIWSADIVSHVGDHYVIQNAAWDATIAPGQSITFRFNADYGADHTDPMGYVLNGVAIPQI